MAGVECGTPETARMTSNKQKSVGWGICTAQKARTTEPTLWLCFSGRGQKMENGEARMAEPKFEVEF